MGMGFQQIHHTVVHCQWFPAANYVEYVFDLSLVQFWDSILLLG